MRWFKKTIPWRGEVVFRGSLQPRAADFEYLEKHRIRIRPGNGDPEFLWSLTLEHPDWGTATLQCPRETHRIDPAILDHDWLLSETERQEARLGESTVLLGMPSAKGHMLRDRKLALRFMRAIMGDDGVLGLDCLGWRTWTRTGLDEELAHDADLDVEAIHSLHWVKTESGEEAGWLHSHGLAEIGGFDFDILRPAKELATSACDALRAIAFAILEERVSTSTTRFSLAMPGGDVQFVDVDRFNALASAADRALRTADDPAHSRKRAVLCDPAGGFFSRFSRKVRPSSYLAGPIDDRAVICFSGSATDLMAERARKTYPVLRALLDELAEFEFPVVAKIGYPTDHRTGPDDREHLWFSIHRCFDDKIDATLENSPLDIAGMNAGDRAEHPVELLTDWIIMTPFGQINPRSMVVVRKIREHREELRAIMAEYRRQSSKA